MNPDYSDLIKIQDKFFNDNLTKDIHFRFDKLKKLKQSIKKRESEIYRALKSDLGKSDFEIASNEIGFVNHELSVHLKNLKKWARSKRVSTPLFLFPSKSRFIKEPFGRVLIISPFNFPFMLALTPLAGAVSAGNTVVLKPSEHTPETSEIIQKVIEDVFDQKHVAVVKGGVETTQALLSERWDMIFFTGSTRVGKIVAEAAAKNLTPVVLELGGKNPVVVDLDADLKIAAKRIIWGKTLNAGQSCVAPDFLLVHRKVKDELLGLMKTYIGEFFGENPRESSNYSRIVSEKAVKRLSELLQKSTVFTGGEYNEKERYFSPAILTEVEQDSPVMTNEIFGPILPVIEFDKIEEVFSRLNNMDKPLVAYYFSENRQKQKEFVERTISGDVSINDIILHFTNPNLPFGGVGKSGMGAYHGKRSFDIFSYERSVFKTPTRFDLPIRYAPYKKWIIRLVSFLMR